MDKNPLNWQGQELSKGKYADYKFPVMVDGIGIRASLYVSGCPFNCLGCYNKKAQNFRWGHDYTPELETQILKDLSNDYVDGITLVGGEPFLNTPILLPLVKRIRAELPNKTVWSWSGYTIEEILESGGDKRELLGLIDVLVDGRFEQDKFHPNLVFRGSWNQRIIDVKESLAQDKVILWQNGEYLKGEDHTPIKLFKTRE